MDDTKQATTRRRNDDDRQPTFVVRAPDPNSRGHWITLGYAWKLKNGKEGFSLKLNAMPVGNWDGALVLLPPYADDGDKE